MMNSHSATLGRYYEGVHCNATSRCCYVVRKAGATGPVQACKSSLKGEGGGCPVTVRGLLLWGYPQATCKGKQRSRLAGHQRRDGSCDWCIKQGKERTNEKNRQVYRKSRKVRRIQASFPSPFTCKQEQPRAMNRSVIPYAIAWPLAKPQWQSRSPPILGSNDWEKSHSKLNPPPSAAPRRQKETLTYSRLYWERKEWARLWRGGRVGSGAPYKNRIYGHAPNRTTVRYFTCKARKVRTFSSTPGVCARMCLLFSCCLSLAQADYVDMSTNCSSIQ